jgi:hypothetical protein
MMGRQVPRTEVKENIKILVDKLEGITPLGILRYIWEQNIKANLKQIR